jgi:hypothetical protein
MPARLPPRPAALTQYRNSSPLQLLQPLLREEQVTGTGLTVSLGTDSLPGAPAKIAKGTRSDTSAEFRTRMSVDLLERISRIRVCCNAFRI